MKLKNIALVTLIACSLFLPVGCTTMTVTKPDGTVVKTTSQDPAVVSAIVTGVTKGLSEAAIAELKNNGFSK